MQVNRKGAVVAIALVLAIGLGTYWRLAGADHSATPASRASVAQDSIVLTDRQLQSVKVAAVSAHAFIERREAYGYIDFNQDRSVQVSSPYAGRITAVHADLGKDVGEGAVLFTIESPDLLEAESSLITAAGVMALSDKTLERARTLIKDQGVAQKELEQAISDQQSAEAAYRAARDAVLVFGKTDAELDLMIASHHTDSTMLIRAPSPGRVTARNAAVGLLVQPGMTPPPFVISDIQSVWLIAAVTEEDLPLIRLGQKVEVTLAALPGRSFDATVTNIGESVDSATRRILVRSEIKDPRHELRPQMFANFVILTGHPVSSPAIPAAGLVREGDGTIISWVTTDHKRFVPRQVQVGMVENGFTQILAGVAAGEEVAVEGAVYLSNALAMANQ